MCPCSSSTQTSWWRSDQWSLTKLARGQLSRLPIAGVDPILASAAAQVSEQDNPLVRRATNSRAFLPLGPDEMPRGCTIWAVT
jgi:hypothetical protein